MSFSSTSTTLSSTSTASTTATTITTSPLKPKSILKRAPESPSLPRAPRRPLPESLTSLIPTELLQHILTFLDPPTLAAASLASSSWLHIARTCKPTYIAIRSHSMNEFTNMIMDKDATMPLYLTHVRLVGEKFGVPEGVEGLIGLVTAISTPTNRSQSPALRFKYGPCPLTALRFESLGWPDNPLPLPSFLSPEHQHLFDPLNPSTFPIHPFTHLTSLSLKKVEFPSFKALVALLYACERVEELGLHLVWWREGLDEDGDIWPPQPHENNPGEPAQVTSNSPLHNLITTSTPPLPSLHTLSLGSTFQSDLLEFFLSFRKIPRVNAIRLKGCYTERDEISVGRWLTALGGVVKSVEAWVGTDGSVGGGGGGLRDADLTYNTSLRSLSLHGISLKPRYRRHFMNHSQTQFHYQHQHPHFYPLQRTPSRQSQTSNGYGAYGEHEYNEYDYYEQTSWIPTLLSQITSSSFTHLAFAFHFPIPQNIHAGRFHASPSPNPSTLSLNPINPTNSNTTTPIPRLPSFDTDGYNHPLRMIDRALDTLDWTSIASILNQPHLRNSLKRVEFRVPLPSYSQSHSHTHSYPSSSSNSAKAYSSTNGSSLTVNSSTPRTPTPLVDSVNAGQLNESTGTRNPREYVRMYIWGYLCKRLPGWCEKKGVVVVEGLEEGEDGEGFW